MGLGIWKEERRLSEMSRSVAADTSQMADGRGAGRRFGSAASSGSPRGSAAFAARCCWTTGGVCECGGVAKAKWCGCTARPCWAGAPVACSI